MRRMSSIGCWHGIACSALAAAVVLLAALPAMATPASFTSSGWGFDPTGLASLPVGSIDAQTPFLKAGAAGTAPDLAVQLDGSTDVCILATGSSTCRASTSGLTGPYSVLLTLDVSVIDPSIEGPFTLMLTSKASGFGYTPAEVQVELDPTAPAGLNTSAVPGFSFGGSFTPFVHIEDRTYASQSVIYDYIAWNVQDGDTVSFRYEVLTAPAGRGTPQLTANVVPFIVVVPEPGTALLMGLGLMGLALGGQRLRADVPRPSAAQRA